MDKCKDIQKELALQIAIKAINNTTGSNRLVPTLLLYRAYPRISNLDPSTFVHYRSSSCNTEDNDWTLLPLSITDQAAAVQKAMADMIKLQATKQVKRTGDKENDTNDLVNQGTVLYHYMTAICYHVMAIYCHLLFFVILCQHCND